MNSTLIAWTSCRVMVRIIMRVFCFLAASVALFACAGRTPEMPAQSPERAVADESAAPTESSSSSSSSSPSDPSGDLVCRAPRAGGGATELFLEWTGNEAHGVLRETAPSGMVHHKKVRAERHQGLVIADDINEEDLVVHMAVVAERAGKKVMKFEDSWSTCE